MIYSEVLFNVCTIATMATLLFALVIRKQTRGRSNVLFFALSAIVLASAIFDIADMSMDSIENASSMDVSFRYFLNYAYFLLRNFSTPAYILFICSFMGIWHEIKPGGKYFLYWLVPYAIDVVVLISNFFYKWVFVVDENAKYYRGSGVYVLYATAFFNIFLGIYIIFKHRELISMKKRFILVVFLPLNVVAVLIQMLVPSLRIELFTSALLALGLTLGVRRPEDMIDYVANANSYNSFLDDTKNYFAAQAPVEYLFIKVTNHSTLRSSIGHSFYTMLLKRISEKIYRMSKIMNLHGDIYYLDQGTYAVVASPEKEEELIDTGRIIVAYMQEPMKLRHLEIMLDAKVCLVKCPSDIATQESLLNFAHTFQYKVPDSKALAVLSNYSGSREFKMRNDMDMVINRGISNKGFQMYYQPIYSIKKDRYASAEALIRLNDEKYGYVSPALFIPVAEESGAIHQIGDYVIDEVCRFIGSEEFKKLGVEYIEINLSVAQCIENNLFEKIKDTMRKYGVKPSQINLEITETSVDFDPSTTDRNINLLSKYGISFSLDDYGVGYSNITRVVSLPLDIVKLDKTFVDEMDSPQMWIVIKNTVKMLKSMNKKILVEGVETEEAYLKFKELGCDYIQGFFFSKPLPEDKYVKFIEYRNSEIKND